MIRLEQVTVRAGTFLLEDIDFEVPTGHYAVLMGRTGSGKTTLLEAICGLRPVACGRIWLMGRDVTWLRPADRGIGYVPQDRAVFQTMTVRDNLGFALEIRHRPRAEVRCQTDRLAELLGLTHLLDRKPPGLSGGETQRVALGRALAARPGILCLDEPLSALDDETREEMYGLLRKGREHTGVTTLHITHHVGEAERLADRILRLQAGCVVPVKRAAQAVGGGGTLT
jgi:molybdate/tungstate transport system ATP-binding protein